MLGFNALGEFAAAEVPADSGRVPVVNADQANFKFAGTANTGSSDFSWAPAVSSFTGDGAATVDVTASAAGAHGVAGAGAATVDAVASASGEYTSVSVTGAGAVTVDATVNAAGAHGVAGAGAVTLPAPTAAAAAGHGVAGSGAASISVSASGAGAHGIAGAGSSTITFTADAVAVHKRYEVSGSVKSSGILVNRRVRVYLRSSGALVNEGDTQAGQFKLHTGFDPVEHYIVPVDLADTATDWLPPVANRVVSVLAQDV